MTFEQEWARCAPWLEAALSKSPDGYSVDAVLKEVHAHRATFWPFPHSAMVTETWLSETGAKEANVWVAGGSMRELLAMAPFAEARLKQDGFSAVSIIGRRGWNRALAAHGFVLLDGELRKVI